MADLMSGSQAYSALENQYGNFIVPAVKIKVNGSDVIAGLGIRIYELKVTLSLKAASCAVIKMDGIYSDTNRAFQSNVKDTFTLGTVVEIELGYLSHTEKVFKGYVFSIGAEFKEQELFIVTLMDVRRLMMTSGKKFILHDVKNYSDVFSAIMGNYSSLCSTEVDATSDNLEKPISQTASDYYFVVNELARKGEREFFVFAEKAYFRKPKKVTSPALTVHYGRELLELTVEHSYLDLSIEVIGYNGPDQAAVSSEKSISTSESQTSIMDTAKVTILDPDADSQEKSTNRAGSFASDQLDKSCTGNGILIGLPEVVPGRYIKVEDLEKLVDQSFYISEVTHLFNEDKFHTYFEIGGCKK